MRAWTLEDLEEEKENPSKNVIQIFPGKRRCNIRNSTGTPCVISHTFTRTQEGKKVNGKTMNHDPLAVRKPSST